jgi:hypothetical protein
MSSESDIRESADKTREAFRRSAAEGHDEIPAQRPMMKQTAGAERMGRGDEVGDLHPFFRGLLDILPEPGAHWPPDQRERWLETARNIFFLLYQDSGGERVPTPLPERARDAAPAEPRFGESSG